LLMLFPLALALFLNTGGLWRWLYAFSSVGMVVILLLAQSRNAYLALLLAGITSYLWGRIRFRYILAVMILLVIMPFLTVILADTIGVQGEEVVSALDTGSKSGLSQDESWLARLEIWSSAVTLMREYPAVGAGLYAFAQVGRANYVYQVVRPTLDISHAHNIFLQSGASLGWAGLLAVAGLWTTVMYGLWGSSHPRPSEDHWMARSLTAGIAGYLIFNSFDVLALEQRAGILVWLVLALVASLISESPSEERWPRWLMLAPLAVAAVLVASPLLTPNLARLQLDRSRFNSDQARATQETESRLGGDVRRLGLLQYMRGNTDRALHYWSTDPDAALYLLGQGQQSYIEDRNLNQAVDWFSLSITLASDFAPAYFWRGLVYEELGLKDDAMSDYRAVLNYGSGELVSGMPLAALTWGNMGRLYMEQGEFEDAVQAFKRALSLAPADSNLERQLEDAEELLKSSN
jgi:tetratricopeptide (TPR) repeat protein